MAWPRLSRADSVAITIGGVAGATLRWLITRTQDTNGEWFRYEPNTSVSLAVEFSLPISTLTVNLLGCLLLGALTLLLKHASVVPRRLLLAAATGFCGSLTTFSTFAVEMAGFLRGFAVAVPGQAASYPADYETAFGTALAYVLLSVLGGAATFWLGRLIAHRLLLDPGHLTIDGGAQ